MTPEALATTGPIKIIGTGLLGASIGLGLSTRGVEVTLSDVSPTTLALACSVGAGRLAAITDDEPALVVVAAPPDVAGPLVIQARPITRGRWSPMSPASKASSPMRCAPPARMKADTWDPTPWRGGRNPARQPPWPIFSPDVPGLCARAPKPTRRRWSGCGNSRWIWVQPRS